MKHQDLSRGLLAAASLSLLAACGGGGSSTPPEPDPVLSVQASATRVRVGEYVQFTGSADKLGLSYSWDFGDGGNGNGALIEHRFDTAGSQSVVLSSTSHAGKRVQASVNVTVEANPEPVAAQNNQWQPGCSGTHCAVNVNGQYAGTGTGVWRYRNAGAGTQTVDVDLAGLTVGQNVTLVFSNASAVNLSETPSAGSSVAALRTTRQVEQAHGVDAAHARLQRRNAGLISADMGRAPGTEAAPTESRRRAMAVPQLGNARVWNDLFEDGGQAVPYSTTLRATCTDAQTGRRLLFWVENSQWDGGTLNQTLLNRLTTPYCGADGGFARVVKLLGDVWGNLNPELRSWLIEDAPGALQDVNIALINTPSEEWGGYFYGVNNFKRSAGSTFAQSNEALVFFVQAKGIARDPAYYTSTLLHELTHMVNFYQRAVVRGVSHDTWLDETSAMMSEDLFADVISPGANKVLATRLPDYVAEAGQSLVDWDDKFASANYAMGGSFGAFLNRRFGPALAQSLIDGCNTGAARYDSHACLDGLLRARGSSIAAEWERFGATVFGGMPQRHAPFGYGFPKTQLGGLLLAGADTSFMGSRREANGMGGATAFAPLSHRHVHELVNASRYQRRGLRLPAGATLTVVVR